MALTDIKTYPVAHNKNGGSGGNTYVMGGQKSSIYNSLNVHSINASQGNIDYLKVKSMSANDASILYLQTREGSIQRLNGDLLQYNTGYIGTLATDTISTKKLKAEDIEAINAFIETIQSKEITTEYLTVTKQAHFFELIIDKIRSVGGQLILTPASCVVDYVWGVTSGGDRIPATPENLNQIVAFDVFWRAEEDTGRSVTNDFIQNDQVICQSFNNAHVGTSYNVSNKYYWRLVDSILSDAYVNLTTGALTQSQQYASTNDYEVAMKITQTKYSGDTYYNNAIKWDVSAQTIQGLQTNVSWTKGTLGQNEAVHGTFSSASQIYGIQITPHEQSDDFPITSRLEFNIKQKVDNSYIIPNKINIGVYFNNDTFMMFNNVLLDGNGDVVLDLDDPDAPIEAIVIVSTADVNWHLCHCMRISNTVCDDMLSGYSSIPSAGDNLVQLGYRGTDDNDRQSAIIISAYKSPDPNVHAPSYAQYMGINDFNLGSHRGSYIDARGAKFVGDITLCSVNGKTIGETLAEQEEEIEKKNKKLLVNAASIQVYTAPNSSSEEVYSLDPSHINVSILAPGDTGMDTLTTVPEGYIVDFSFFNNNNIDVSSNNFSKTANQSLSNIELPKGTYIGDISRLRIRLIKDEAGVPAANAIVVDYVDLSYIRAALPSVDGGRYEFRYKNSATQPNAPIGTGESNGWSRIPTNPTESEKYTWMSQTYVNGNDEYGTWTTPIRITGPQGEHGADGNDIEFIYTRNNTGTDPSTPATSQTDDYVPSGWTDNPQGVASNMMYEYISTRTKENGTWSAFSTPVVWSKWGEKGMDGDGYEYIFKSTAENTNPGAPADSPQTDNYVPSGWSDEPVTLTSTNAFLWVCVRKKTRGVWGRFSNPSLWSHYATAEGGTPGADGNDAEFNYLVPNKEILMAMIINSISDNANCDLKCELDYSLVHVKGSNVSTLSWATSSYVLRIIAYNASGSKIGDTIYATNNGYANGTPQGTYSQSNLLSVLNSAAAQRDYMKCYTQYNSKCPVYLEVSLMSGNTVLDKRIVPVELENGAVLKVTDDAINSAVAKANTNMNTTLNNYSTTQQTAELITNTVNAQMSNYSTTAQMNSAIQQSAQSITSTVSSNYYNKNEVDVLLNDENSTKEIIDLKNKDENTYYPISVNMAPGGINGTPIANGLILTMQVDRSLSEGGSYGTDDWYGSPSWGSTYPGQSYGRGVALLCNWSIVPSGWGEWGNGEMFVNNYTLRWTAKGSNTNDANNTRGVKVIGNLEQHEPSNTMIFYLRGGSKYNFRCNWAGLHHEVHTSSWSTGTSQPKTYNTIYGADSPSIIVPTKDKMNKSEIEQTARRISLSVYSEQDSGDGVTTEQLKRTGIDITAGKIELTADNTNINGNLNIYNANEGFQIYEGTTPKISILNRNLGTDPTAMTDYKDVFFYKEIILKPGESTFDFGKLSDSKIDFGTFINNTTVTLSDFSWNIRINLSENGVNGWYGGKNVLTSSNRKLTWSGPSNLSGSVTSYGNIYSLNKSFTSTGAHEYMNITQLSGTVTGDGVSKYCKIAASVKGKVRFVNNSGILLGHDAINICSPTDNRYVLVNPDNFIIRNGKNILRIKDGHIQRNDGSFGHGRYGEMGGTIFGDISSVVPFTYVGDTNYNVTNNDAFILISSDMSTTRRIYLPNPNTAPLGKIIYIKNISPNPCIITTKNGYEITPTNDRNPVSEILLENNKKNRDYIPRMFICCDMQGWMEFKCG